jgi:hypothetical protein
MGSGKGFSVNENYMGRKMEQAGQKTIIHCSDWQVERPRRIAIHKMPDEILPPLNHPEGYGGFRSRRLSFCRNIIVNFIHQL